MSNQSNCYPSIGFPGNCDEAITFYKEAMGAEVKVINYFRDVSPDTDTGLDETTPPNTVLFSEVLMFGTTFVMTDFEGTAFPDENHHFWITAIFDSAEEATSVFDKLAENGKVIEPLVPQFWASLNGYVNDRFGIHWNVLTRG